MAGTLNDEILRATGGQTVSDGLAVWFAKSPTESLQDAELRWLHEQHPTAPQHATANDMWGMFILPAGGSINDKQLAYWQSQP